MNIFDFLGIPLRPEDMQNATPQYQDLRPYTRSPEEEYAYIQGMRPYQMFPERPLDERFADFKVRLAAAIERQRKKSPMTI